MDVTLAKWFQAAGIRSEKFLLKLEELNTYFLKIFSFHMLEKLPESSFISTMDRN